MKIEITFGGSDIKRFMAALIGAGLMALFLFNN